MKYDRHSARVIKSRRWKALRLEALRRDEWKCRKCGASGRLEVHHVQRVRDFPELAYSLDNLLTLCARCHAGITRIECGNGSALDAPRNEWREAIRALCANKEKKTHVAVCTGPAPPVGDPF